MWEETLFGEVFNEKKAANGGAVRSLHTPSQTWMGGNDKSFGANALSSATNNIIPQTLSQSQANLKQAKIKTLKDEVKKISEKNIQTKDRDIER